MNLNLLNDTNPSMFLRLENFCLFFISVFENFGSFLQLLEVPKSATLKPA